MSEPEAYSNIRSLLGELIGKRVVDITQHDPEDFAESGSFVMLMFEEGLYLKVPIGDEGFATNCDA